LAQHSRSRNAPAPYDATARYDVPERYDARPAAYQESAWPAEREFAPAQRSLRLTAAESFWYVLQCIAFGAGYFAKVPAKKALEEAGLAEMTAAEKFWYVLQCIAFGAGYFAKLPVKKALTEASALASGR
jgi:hypothetical protein